MSVIVTKRLMLGKPPYAPGMLRKMVGWLSDPDVVQYSDQRHKDHDIGGQLEYINSFKWPSQYRVIFWGEEPIGTITAHVDCSNLIADLGILIGDKQCWGEGFGTEAWIGMMDHVFGIGIRKIEAGCMSPNFPMKKIFEKSGMDREGYRHNHFLFNGKREDMELWRKFDGR